MQILENFCVSNFVMAELRKAIISAGFITNPFQPMGVSHVRETPEGFIRYTLTMPARSAGFSGHQNAPRHEFEVLQSVPCPTAVRVTIKGNRISIKHY